MFVQSESIDKLAAALATASAEMSNPPLDGKNPHFKSKFATLACVRDTVTPTLSKYGLSVSQFPCEVEGVGPGLCTVLMHQSGQFMRATIALRPAKNDPQGIGAAMTYARRYGLQAVCGVVGDDDDDGEQASRPAQQQQRQQAAPPPPQQQQRKPAPSARPTSEELKHLLTSRGWQWRPAVHTINAAEGTDYLESHLPDDILTDHLARFCDHLRSLPEKVKGAKS